MNYDNGYKAALLMITYNGWSVQTLVSMINYRLFVYPVKHMHSNCFAQFSKNSIAVKPFSIYNTSDDINDLENTDKYRCTL